MKQVIKITTDTSYGMFTIVHLVMFLNNIYKYLQFRIVLIFTFIWTLMNSKQKKDYYAIFTLSSD